MANKNKVYINPKFNKLISSNVNSNQQNKIIMHVNPHFTQQSLSNKNKIYVNPNFLNTNVLNSANQEVGIDSALPKNQPIINETNCAIIDTQLDQHIKQPQVSLRTRYTLVRQHNNKTNQSQVSEKVTVKINKYKSVALSKYKTNLDIIRNVPGKVKTNLNNYSLHAKQAESSVILKNEKFSSLRPHKFYRNKYKLRKLNISVHGVESKSLNRRSISIERNWKDLKTKVTKRNLKKNNIPCPLFKKYGKCLRSINGSCEFLHDKKHVSLCRKFLKGLCQEKSCLLSHEVSAKKMPTCYFYLKGLCTKDDCQYLHVKLNDKSKICQEFLKGYCEKGDRCLNRHIFTKIRKKNQIMTASCSLTHVKMKLNSSRKSKPIEMNIKDEIPLKIDDCAVTNSEPNSNECRYYNEVMGKSKDAENIKPSRCKLGNLPSFIKL